MKTQINTAVATDTEYEEAVKLHCLVMTSRDQVANSLCEFAKHLKAMRDGKLYIKLNCSSFDDYINQHVKISTRQVYKHIEAYEKLGEKVLQSTAGAGIEKLSLLAQVPDIERSDFIQENDLQGLSVKELKEIISKYKEQSEQVSLLLANNDKLSNEIEEFKQKPIEVAVAEPSQADIDKIKAEAEKQAKEKFKADIDKLKKENEAKLEKATATAKAEAEKQAFKKLKASLTEAENEKAKLLEQTQKLSKELELIGDNDIVKITVLFDAFKDSFIKLLETISTLADLDKKAKLLDAVKLYSDTVVADMVRVHKGV